MNKVKRKSWFILNTVFLLLFICMSVYFFSLLSNNNYIGIRAQKIDNTWLVKKVQLGGAAGTSDIQIGDKIILVDNQIPQKNALLNRWRIVEQAESIVVSRSGNTKTLFFQKTTIGMQLFLLFFSLSLLCLFFLFRMPQLWSTNRSSKQLYFLGLTIIFSSLAVIPSSIGDFLGRLIIVLFISSFPVYLFLFLNGSKPKTAKKKALLFIILLIGIVNITLTAFSYVIELPNFVIEYLAIGVFYLLGAILFLLAMSSLQKRSLDEKHPITQINLSLISLLSFLPLFLFYVLPTNWVAPFYLVVIFTILPIFGIVHLLILSRFIKSRYKLPKTMLYLLLSLLFSSTIFFVFLLTRYVPIWILTLYLFFLIYSFLPLIEEIILTSRKKLEGSDPIALFVAIEEERESIAIFIHDTVVQDVIYTMKKVEEGKDSRSIVHELDEIMFHLRELCSDIYPLMIQEMGLTNTIISMINQTKQKHPVEIFHTIDPSIEFYAPKVSNFILRSLKEFINNSIIHGKAENVTVTISCIDKKCLFEVQDDGHYLKNSSDSHAHFGLDVIKEKLILLGGELIIDYSKQTTVTMKIPNHNEEE